MKMPRRTQPGQALVTMALFAIVLFVFVGLGIDSGMIYMERRHLQNVADAACLAASTEISLGGSATSARTAANDYIISNMDANARAAFQLPADLNTLDFLSSQIGTGVSLTRGIEVSGSDVRVAVTFPAFTYFMRLGGIDTYNVMARARCDATQGGGVWPVAVVRFPGYDNSDKRVGVADTGATLPQTYGNGSKPKELKVRDILQAADVGDGVLNDGTGVGGSGCSTTRNWYNWPDLGDPASKTGPYNQPCKAASLTSPGYEVEMVGLNANPNLGNTSYSGPLILDARQISFTPRLFYNGQSASTSLNAWKDTITKYILTQYPGPDVLAGQQIGVISGISAGLVEKPINERYNEGDVVTTLIYNGQLYQDPDFKVKVTCKTGSFNCTSPNLVHRVAPPATLFNTTCTSYDGKPYIADGSDPDFAKANPAPQPAEYVVNLAPTDAKTAAATSVQLIARLSGENLGSDNRAGAPEDFAHMKVRWEWQDASGGWHYAPSKTGWQNPEVAVEVDMPSSPLSGVNVTLKVIQSDKETKQCIDPANPLTPISITVPKRVSGAHTIQVIGRSGSGPAATSRQHSDYGALGMYKNISGLNFNSEDFYFTFVNDPTGVVKTTSPKADIEVDLELEDANSSSGKTLSWSKISSSSLVYYKDGARLSGAPTGVTATSGHSGQTPTLKISIDPATAAVGEYDIDYQVSTSGGTHSTRYHLRVEEPINSSIDSWIVNLCYANFRITDMSSPNVVLGEAVSGCLDPGQITAGLTSRLTAWN